MKVRITSSQAAAWLGTTAVVRKGMLVLCATTALAVCANSSANLPAERHSLAWRTGEADPRVDRLDRFFRRYNCPSPRHIKDYLRAADGYRLDYRLLPALSIRETHCGLEEMRNNRWGYDPGRGFVSVEAGIYFVARQLAESPFYRGKSLEDKLFTYNPLPKYPGEVQSIMREIE